jgi:hypothetical protein
MGKRTSLRQSWKASGSCQKIRQGRHRKKCQPLQVDGLPQLSKEILTRGKTNATTNTTNPGGRDGRDAFAASAARPGFRNADSTPSRADCPRPDSGSAGTAASKPDAQAGLHSSQDAASRQGSFQQIECAPRWPKFLSQPKAAAIDCLRSQPASRCKRTRLGAARLGPKKRLAQEKTCANKLSPG